MRQTKQKRTKRRRTTMKRIKKNKVMYGGFGRINTKNELDVPEAKTYRNFQLTQQQLMPVTILDTPDIQRLKRFVNDKNVFDSSGKIKDEFELMYM